MTEHLWKGCLIGATVVLLLAVYFNRAYAHIYSTIGMVGLEAPARPDFYTKEVAGGDQKLKVAFIGDSLTAGVGTARFEDSYPYQLGKMIADKKSMHMTVHAVSGFKAADALRDLVPLTVKDEADIVFLLVGVNDVHGQTSLEEFKESYGEILTALQGKEGRRVFTLTIPKIGSPHLLYPPYDWYFHWRTDAFNNVIAELAEQNGATLIDFSELTRQQMAAAGATYALDEFHPSAFGYGYWATVVYAAYSR